MDVKGWKTLGNSLSQENVKKVKLISERVGEFDPVVVEEEVEILDDTTDDGENNTGGSPIAPPPPPPPPIMNGDNPQLDLL